MIELGLRTTGEYASLVRGSDAELQALIEEVVFPEELVLPRRPARSASFRNTPAPDWIGEPAACTLAVLSMPCAGGEEPYSIAIALFQIGLCGRQFRVDAVDISAPAARARPPGPLPQNAFRGNDQASRRLYFQECPRGLRSIAEGATWRPFHAGNILDPSSWPTSRVTTCLLPQLLIYLDTPHAAARMAHLDRLWRRTAC